MNKKKIIIVTGVVLGVFGVILILVERLTQVSPPTRVGQIPSPSITLVPTTTPHPDQLYITSVLPEESPKEPHLPIQKLTVVFSDKVRPELLKYEITPRVEVVVKQGEAPNSLYIVPTTKWVLGETIITILQSTKSLGGKTLFASYFYKMSVDIPLPPKKKSIRN